MRLRVVDIETTGFQPPAEVIEVGIVDVVQEGGGWRVCAPEARLYRPLREIPPETMAVHHLTPDCFPPHLAACDDDALRSFLLDGEPFALVAHNCEFERAFISEAATNAAAWICTYKCALRAWPMAPKHSNQVLRYWRGLNLDENLAMPPHRAGPDAYVTAHLLAELLQQADPNQLLQWTREPKAIVRIPFGKHRGSAWADVPADYLKWVCGQSDMNPDVVWCARGELERRAPTIGCRDTR